MGKKNKKKRGSSFHAKQLKALPSFASSGTCRSQNTRPLQALSPLGLCLAQTCTLPLSSHQTLQLQPGRALKAAPGCKHVRGAQIKRFCFIPMCIGSSPAKNFMHWPSKASSLDAPRLELKMRAELPSAAARLHFAFQQLRIRGVELSERLALQQLPELLDQVLPETGAAGECTQRVSFQLATLPAAPQPCPGPGQRRGRRLRSSARSCRLSSTSRPLPLSVHANNRHRCVQEAPHLGGFGVVFFLMPKTCAKWTDPRSPLGITKTNLFASSSLPWGCRRAQPRGTSPCAASPTQSSPSRGAPKKHPTNTP